MADVRVEMNHGGAGAVLVSAEVGADLLRRARAIAAAASLASSADRMGHQPFEARPGRGRTRAVAYVVAATPHGRRASRRMLNNLGAGR